MEVTKEERHILQHSLGGREMYRNHFCTNEDTVDYPACEKLVEKGLMQRRKAADWQGGGLIYNVTDEGKAVAFDNDTPADFHTRCNDCGKFLKKKRWVPKDHSWKKHALCRECLSGYDGPEYY